MTTDNKPGPLPPDDPFTSVPFEPPLEVPSQAVSPSMIDTASEQVLLEEPQVRLDDSGHLKKKATKSAVWTVLGFVVMQVLRFASNIILAKLLFPEVFGLMALVNVFIQGLHMFSDIGIGPSIVQSKRGDDPQYLDTAWTMQILRGLVLWFGTALIAWPAAVFYGDMQLLQLIPVVGLATAISGFNSTAMYVLSRQLMQGRLVLLDVTRYLLSFGATIAWVVYVERGVWALVIGNLVDAVIQLTASHFLLPGVRNHFRWNKGEIGEVLHFGKWIFLSTMFTFMAGQSDRLLVGKLDSLSALGVYHFALMLAQVPVQLLYSLNMQLAFPIYSRAHQTSGDMRVSFSKMHPLLAGFAAFAVTGLIASGPTFVYCIYDNRYRDAAWIVQFLAVGAYLQILEATAGSLLWAIGKTGASAMSNGAKAISLPLLALAGWSWGSVTGSPSGGLIGMLLGFIIGDLIRYLVTAWFVHKQRMPIFRYDIALAFYIAFASFVAIQIGNLPGLAEHKWPRFGVEVVAVILLWLLPLLYGYKKGIVRRNLRAAM